MPNKNKTLLSMISVLALFLSVYLFYAQPKWLIGLISNQPRLYGHLTTFRLTDYPMKNQFGELVTWKDYSHKPLYVTTGFTSCANSCPVTMSHYQRLAKKLDQKASFAFVTIDPTRDSFIKLEKYLQGFNEDFIGIRISDDTLLKNVVDEFKQSVFITTNESQITHKYFIYLIHPKIKGFIIYDAANPDINLMAEDIKILSLI